MHISRKAVDASITRHMEANLAIVLADLKNKPEVLAFFHDFFTEAEQTVLMKRLAIAVMLSGGNSYQEIKDQLKVSSATISFVAENINKPGIKTAVSKIKTDQWAEGVITSFSKLLKKKSP